MNKEEYFKYYIQGSDHYLIPRDIFEELFNEMNNWKQELKAVRKGLSKVSVKRNKWKNRYYKEKMKNRRAKSYIKKHSNNEAEYLDVWEVKELLQILDKGESNE